MYSLLALWATCVVSGLFVMASYANAPTPTATQPSLWPLNSGLQRIVGRPTLIMLLHPQCSCSHASLEELSRLLAHRTTPIDLQFLLFMPETEPQGWQNSRLISEARAFPAASVVADLGGKIAVRFGLSVSGQTALYAPSGELLFSGGITASRGHAGDNAGGSGIRAILLGTSPATRHTPVFGCSIRSNS